jgi:hypothetical protein
MVCLWEDWNFGNWRTLLQEPGGTSVQYVGSGTYHNYIIFQDVLKNLRGVRRQFVRHLSLHQEICFNKILVIQIF